MCRGSWDSLERVGKEPGAGLWLWSGVGFWLEARGSGRSLRTRWRVCWSPDWSYRYLVSTTGGRVGAAQWKLTVSAPKTSCNVSLSRASSLPRYIRRCWSPAGLVASVFLIFSFSWRTVVEAGRPAKVKGLLTPTDGDKTCTLAVGGPFSCGGPCEDEAGDGSAMVVYLVRPAGNAVRS